MQRIKPSQEKPAGTDYFPSRSLKFVHTGCTLLDCVIGGGQGGGWPLGRIVNIVGDKSVGKSLLAIEACANFTRQYPKGKIRYREAEAAFDVPYAETLGLPTKSVDFGPQGIATQWHTVDAIFDDLEKCVSRISPVPGMYIIDSLDALSTLEERHRDRSKGTYGAQKPKILSELFRCLAADFKAANMNIIFISQIRDKIGVTFGAKYSRTGGKALDFYASIVLYLSHVETIYHTVKGVKRAVAVRIRAKCTKNKIHLPFRDCEFVIRFGFGVDDLAANLNWLNDVGRIKLVGFKDLGKKKNEEQIKAHVAYAESLPEAGYQKELVDVSKLVRMAWDEVEEDFRPKRRKY